MVDRKIIRKFNGEKYVLDRTSKRGKKGRSALRKIAEAGKKNGVLRSYRLITGKNGHTKLFIR